MLHYARSDTHFLLAIYDHIRLALHALALNPPPPSTDPDAMPIDPPTAQSLLSEVYRRSTKTSSNIFEISPYDSKLGMGQDGWRSILNRTAAEKQYETALAVPTLPIKTGWGEGEVKLEVLRAIHAWRETTARREDEGVRYLLSKEGIWAIVEHTPRTGLEVMQVLAKTRSGVSEWVRQNKDEVAEVVVAALGKVTVGKVRMVEGEEEVEVERKEGKARESASQPAVAPLGGLWDAPAVVAVPIKAAKSTPFGAVRAATSSFFGGRAPPAVVAPIVVVAPVATKSSSLFARASSFFSGKQEPKVSKSSPDVVMLDVPPLAVVETASQKVARVHASLVLGGGLANVRAPFLSTASVLTKRIYSH
jgi:exosome complex exonuclease RRP6